MDPGLEEAIATILWAAPRLQTDVQEMREVYIVLFVPYVLFDQTYIQQYTTYLDITYKYLHISAKSHCIFDT